MSEEYNDQIEKVAKMIIQQGTSIDEQDETKLKKYYDFVKEKFHLEGEPASQLVSEAFLYLRLKNADSIDLLQHGDKFGAGFS